MNMHAYLGRREKKTKTKKTNQDIIKHLVNLKSSRRTYPRAPPSLSLISSLPRDLKKQKLTPHHAFFECVRYSDISPPPNSLTLT